MLTFDGRRVFLVIGPTDMRKSFNGLSGIVGDRPDRDSMSRDLFLFCNRGRNRQKALVYDESGARALAKRPDLGTVVTTDPTADHLDRQDVGEPREHRLAAGPQRLGLARQEAQGLVQPLVLAVVPDIDAQERRQRVDQPFAERLVEADHHADQSGQRSAATVTQQLVAWTDALHRQVEEIARRGPGRADQAVPETVRHQREAARGPEFRRVAVGLEPAVAGAGSAYVTFSPDLAVPEAPAAIRAFTAAAVDAGLRRLVLLSGRGEPNAQLCEEIVRGSGLETTVLRASWFAQNFGEGVFLDGVREGVVAAPAGRVR